MQGARGQVHTEGCKDVLKFGLPWTVEAETLEEVVRLELDMDRQIARSSKLKSNGSGGLSSIWRAYANGGT